MFKIMLSSLSIVIPTYNEEDCIIATIEDVFKKINSITGDLELIISDDGSSDATVDIVRQIPDSRIKIIESNNTGKGGAVKRGVSAASKEYLLFMDADNSASVDQVQRFLPYIKEHYVVVGSRELDRKKVQRDEKCYRKITGRMFNFSVRFLLGLKIKDTQCGFKFFKMRVAKRLFSFLRESGFVFDVEILYLAKKMGFSIHEVGINWFKSEKTSVNLFRDGISMFYLIFKIRQRWSKYEF